MNLSENNETNNMSQYITTATTKIEITDSILKMMKCIENSQILKKTDTWNYLLISLTASSQDKLLSTDYLNGVFQ